MRVQRKTRRGAGFTLAETLLAVLILSLVASLMASGIPFAKSAYERVVVGANARLLFYNTVSALRNELGTAANVAVDSTNNSITYYSADIHSNSKIYLQPEDSDLLPQGTLMLQQFVSVPNITLNESGVGVPRRLVSAAGSNKDLYVTWTSISYSGDMLTITGLQVANSKTKNPVFPLSEPDQPSGSQSPIISVRVVVGPITTAAVTAPSEGAGEGTTPGSGE